ncbi:MAG: hypothetical protein AABZ55_04460, partial [Bdellovibrionota bacterium]
VTRLEPEPLQLYRIVNIQPEPPVFIAKMSEVRHRRPVPRRSPAITKRPKLEQVVIKEKPVPTEKSSTVAEALAPVMVSTEAQAHVVFSPGAGLDEKVKTLLAVFQKQETKNEPPAVNIQIKNIQADPPISDEINTHAAAPEPVITQAAVEYPKEPPTSETREFSGFVSGPNVALANGYSQVAVDYPNINFHFFDQGGANDSPKTNPPPSGSRVAIPDDKNDGRNARSILDTEADKVSESDEAGESKTPEATNGFVEFFKWNDIIADATSSMMSREEVLGEGVLGWQLAQSSNHWSTVYWGFAGNSPSRAIPLIHSNTAAILAKQAGFTLQADTGIIFGKIGRGWTTEVTGRKETTLYFTEAGQSVSPQETQIERIFLVFNVSPGSHEVVAR